MVKCDFCGEHIEEGTGKMYVQKDAKSFHFCSNKCQKNMINLGRKPRVTRWTQTAVKLKAGKAQ